MGHAAVLPPRPGALPRAPGPVVEKHGAVRKSLEGKSIWKLNRLYLKALRTKNPLSREIKKVLDSKREARAAQPPEQRIAECRQNQTKLLGQFNTAVDKAKKHYKV